MNTKEQLEKYICNICKEEITKKDIEKGNIITTINKLKNKNYAHKTCLIRR